MLVLLPASGANKPKRRRTVKVKAKHRRSSEWALSMEIVSEFGRKGRV